MLLAGSITQLVLTAAVVLVGIATLFVIGLIIFMLIVMVIEKIAKEAMAHGKRSKRA